MTASQHACVRMQSICRHTALLLVVLPMSAAIPLPNTKAAGCHIYTRKHSAAAAAQIGSASADATAMQLPAARPTPLTSHHGSSMPDHTKHTHPAAAAGAAYVCSNAADSTTAAAQICSASAIGPTAVRVWQQPRPKHTNATAATAQICSACAIGPASVSTSNGFLLVTASTVCGQLSVSQK